jgi:hypothetical protein
MPKTFPIRLDVEEIALGTVLRKLNEMPGIVNLHLDLGHGGQGSGRKQLEQHAAVAHVQNGSREPLAIKMLMQGPKHIREISAVLGGAKSRAYGLTNTMSKKGLVERGEGAGMWQLTKKAMAQLGKAMPAVTPAVPAMAALPAPAVRHGPSGRALPGSGPIILRAALGAGPMTPHDLRGKLAEGGMSAKGVSGVLDRARRAGLIKKNGQGYELTAKGLKIEMGAQHNG